MTVAVLQDGVYIKGLYLQGAGWDKKNSVLIEAEPMQLVCPLPSIHFKPTEAKKKSSKGKRVCVAVSLQGECRKFARHFKHRFWSQILPESF